MFSVSEVLPAQGKLFQTLGATKAKASVTSLMEESAQFSSV